MAKISRELNLQLFLMYVPLDVEVFMRNAETASHMNEKFRKIADDLGIFFVDVLTPLRKKQNSNLYFDEVHLTKSGNEIIAETLSQSIHKQLPLDHPTRQHLAG